MASHWSMIAAARGSVARASAFSSSVSVSTRRVRISSISVESNRATELSGCHGGVVVQNDRRHQQHVRLPLGARQDGPAAVLGACCGGVLCPVRRVQQRQEVRAAQAQEHVGADERRGDRILPVRRFRSRRPAVFATETRSRTSPRPAAVEAAPVALSVTSPCSARRRRTSRPAGRPASSREFLHVLTGGDVHGQHQRRVPVAQPRHAGTAPG